MHERAARGFDRAAEEYEQGRPGYPTAAIDLLTAELGFGPGSTVVDLAAGTGKLTRALVPSGAHVIAVEPVPGMRAQLVSAVPGVETLAGTAEAIPMPDASADAVLVAQAFHWFDTAAAAREIHRVLRRSGGLGVIWNAWDESFAWFARVQELVGAYRGDTPQRGTSRWREQLTATGLFTPLADRALPNVVNGSVDVLLARTASISFIATLPESERAKVLDAVRAVVAEHPEAWVEGELVMPYVTQVAWCHATDA
ncbi:MAG TPA: class I SAM-dependent methyltransferase [Solirubrobacteraceae bacterium]|nr:class I SAM-dependent methyltransferase [Solirubrobacteraceae bacterium]